MHRQNIKSLAFPELAGFVESLGLPAYRTKQIWHWVWEKHVHSFQDMTNVPATLRAALEAEFSLFSPFIEERHVSSDGARKYLVGLEDGTLVETVGIPSASRLTVCFSTQAGCAMGCRFCATGRGGFSRNLLAYEMYEQVSLVARDFQMRVSNVVAMGQGEPFATYDSLMAALRLMNDPSLLSIGARHITVSTCGVIPGIYRFAQEPEQFTLAVSLHAAVQETRDYLMPGVASFPLPALKDAIKTYGDTTKRRPTVEYSPIDGVNDDEEHVEALVRFCSGMLCHVNLIPLNRIETAPDETPLVPSPRTEAILAELHSHGIEASTRISRGGDISGACGQLTQKHRLVLS